MEVSNQWASLLFEMPEVRCAGPVLVGRAQPTLGMPELLSAPGHPPMMIGKAALESDDGIDSPSADELIGNSVQVTVRNFLPLPTGRSRTEASTNRCGTSNPSRLRSLRRL